LVAAAALAIAHRAAAQTTTSSVLAAEADSVARTAGFPADIRSQSLPSGDLEIRAYVGFGIGAPEHLVRIQRRAGRVTGQLVLWWPGTTLRFDVPDDPERPIAQHDQEAWAAAMRQNARAKGCGTVVQGGWVETCTLDKSARVDWTKTLASLDTARITRLAPEPVSPGIDGTSLYVEVRDGARYREYSFWNPSRSAHNLAERAAAHLTALLLRLFDR
jgi:hypothetical protein